MSTRSSIFLSASFALIAFAANSLLCRAALRGDYVDPSLFTTIRLTSGALTLLVMAQLKKKKKKTSLGKWKSGIFLFGYAAAFSFAYVSLDAGSGALILFGTVQITMIVFGFISGKKLSMMEWMGLLFAATGLIYLVLPGLSSPPLVGFLLMSLAGISWAAYTLMGRKVENPVSETAYNFLRSLVIAIPFSLFFFAEGRWTFYGILLAVISGAITSGMGYAIWYYALRGLSITQAAVIQLLVPILAAFAGVLFLKESFTIRLFLSSLFVLGGIWLAAIYPALKAKKVASH